MQLDAIHAIVAVRSPGCCRITEALIYATLQVQNNFILVKGKYFACADAIKQTLQDLN